MEGWYVRRLILDRSLIKSKIYTKLDEDSFGNSFYEGEIIGSCLDDDTYIDLLDVESKIKELIDKKALSPREVAILNLILDGRSYSEISSSLKVHRMIITKTFNNLCSKLSYHLGDHFTNEGYINYFSRKYKLTPIENELLRRYISND